MSERADKDEAGVFDGRRRCAATTRSGNRCRRRAVEGSSFCRQHLGARARATEYFGDLFTPEEWQALEYVEGSPHVDDIIPVLLVAIRRALEGGESPSIVVRACEAYVRAVRERQKQRGGSVAEGDDALDAALDELSKELGVEL